MFSLADEIERVAAPDDRVGPESSGRKRYLVNWRDEIDSAALYRALAELESDPRLVDVYRRLAAAEERHADFWEGKLRAAGARVPERRPGWRTRLLIAIARRFGTQLVLPTLNDLERSDSRGYDEQPESRGTAMPAEERSHARLLQSLSGGVGVEGTALGRLEGRHRAASGNALRAAVLGANDGLLSNFSLVMGVTGAQVSADTILVTGLAGLLAGAGSMAMGEWISVQSARELAGHQLEIEAREIEEIPDEEREELALIYEAKGLDRERPGRSPRGRSPTARLRSTHSRARSSGSTPTSSVAPLRSLPERRSCSSPSARSCRSFPTSSSTARPPPSRVPASAWSGCSPSGR